MSVCRRAIVYVWTPMTLIRGGGFCWWIRIPAIRIISALDLSRLDTHTQLSIHIYDILYLQILHIVYVYISICISRRYKRISYILGHQHLPNVAPKSEIALEISPWGHQLLWLFVSSRVAPAATWKQKASGPRLFLPDVVSQKFIKAEKKNNNMWDLLGFGSFGSPGKWFNDQNFLVAMRFGWRRPMMLRK